MLELILDASQLEVIESCIYKWYLEQVRNLTTRRTNPALSTGSFYHEIFKYYYSRTELPRSTNIQAALRFANELLTVTELTPRLIELGVRSVQWPAVRIDPKFHLDRLVSYFATNMIEDDTSEVLAIEKGFSTLLFESPTRRFILEGVIDLLSIEQATGLTITDHKTQSRLYDKYEYCHQALNYLSFTEANYFRYSYTGLQDKVNTSTFRRTIFKPAEGMIQQWKSDVLKTFHSLADIIEETGYKDIFELERLTKIKIGEAFPRRRSACKTQFGLCQFHRICETPDSHPLLPNVLQSYKEKEDRWRAWS